jgi:predicted component of type VI protein secretion system
MTAPLPLRCPKCHEASTDAEFCSECGAPMIAPPPAAAAPSPPDPAATICPDCGQPRPGPLARFCDNCRYDFVAGQSFSAARPTPTPAAPPLPAPPSPAPPPQPPPAPAPTLAAAIRYDLIAAVDVSLRKPEDPEPTDFRERIFPLDLADCLIGRRSDREDIHPEIPIGDPGISRRHARLIRQPDGGLALLDLGSMNGTRLNGRAVEPNILTPLAATDQITLGCWTRLSLRPR